MHRCKIIAQPRPPRKQGRLVFLEGLGSIPASGVASPKSLPEKREPLAFPGGLVSTPASKI